MDTQKKTRIITLTSRAPVKIVEEEWPVVAVGRYADHDGEVRCQANRTWISAIRVRRNNDGRQIVYGSYVYDTACRGEENFTIRAGRIVSDENVVEMIQQVGREIISELRGRGYEDHVAECIRECIADLPPEEI